MPLRLVPSFLFFTFINGITPGPANLSSLSVSLNCGKQVALRQWRGIFTGFFIDAMIAALICYFLGKAAGDKIYFLSYVGAAYIVWLAIRILQSRPENEMGDAKNYGFKSGLIVQLTNVKAILFCITVLSSYVRIYTDSILDLFLAACVLPFIGGPLGNLAWLFAGVSLQGLFQRHWRAVNIVMALSLIVCAVNLVVR